MTFEGGVPKSVNGKEMKVSDIIRELNRLGGKHGIGIVDIVENRVVGMKSRGVYETPGGTILMEAHQQLEELILDRDTMTVKKDMGNKFAQIVYEGKWFTPLREAVQAFVESTQKYVTGEVKFKLYKGNIIKAGTTSPYSLYSESLASFTTGDLYDHHDAEGFITLFGLPLKVRAMKLSLIHIFPVCFPAFSSEDNYDTQGISQIVKISTHSKDAPIKFPAERMQPLKKAAFYSLFVFSPFFCPSSK